MENSFDALKILLSVVAGIGGVVALTVAYRRQHLGEAAERRENTKLFNDRFTKAAELIGSDKAAIRLAGIYAVAALADDWTDGRQTCIEVLCAYLRMPYMPPADPEIRAAQPLDTSPNLPPSGTGLVGQSDRPSRDPREERQVRHTVIRLIRDHLRLPPEHRRSWAGHDLDFTGAVFDGGDFSHARFSGGEVSFSAAEFAGGEVSFEHARFSGSEVSFRGARFAGSRVMFRFTRFTRGAVSFSGAEFAGGVVTFPRAQFSVGQVPTLDARTMLNPPKGLALPTP